MLLFIAQTALFASHRLAAHRREWIRSLSSPSRSLTWSLFATFVIAALVLRRNKGMHKRLMLLAYISIIIAAVARLHGVNIWGL